MINEQKIVGIVIIVTLIGIIGFYMANRNKVVQVDAAIAVEGSIEKYVEELGIVKAKNQGGIFMLLLQVQLKKYW